MTYTFIVFAHGAEWRLCVDAPDVHAAFVHMKDTFWLIVSDGDIAGFIVHPTE